jgi:transposase InsO family protein
MTQQAVEELTPLVGTRPACRALGVAPATIYRRRRPAQPPPEPRPRPRSGRSLSLPEQEAVLEVLRSERFVDSSPAQVWATLLDEGRYLCSERTMYRLLAQHQEVRERRDQLTHPAYARPELLAERPNQVWSWDITKLLGPQKWSYYYLYVILDVFSPPPSTTLAQTPSTPNVRACWRPRLRRTPNVSCEACPCRPPFPPPPGSTGPAHRTLLANFTSRLSHSS